MPAVTRKPCGRNPSNVPAAPVAFHYPPGHGSPVFTPRRLARAIIEGTSEGLELAACLRKLTRARPTSSAIERITALLAVSAFDPAILWTGAYLAGRCLSARWPWKSSAAIYGQDQRKGRRPAISLPISVHCTKRARSARRNSTVCERYWAAKCAAALANLRRRLTHRRVAPKTTGEVSPNGEHPPPASENGIKPV